MDLKREFDLLLQYPLPAIIGMVGGLYYVDHYMSNPDIKRKLVAIIGGGIAAQVAWRLVTNKKSKTEVFRDATLIKGLRRTK